MSSSSDEVKFCLPFSSSALDTGRSIIPISNGGNNAVDVASVIYFAGEFLY